MTDVLDLLDPDMLADLLKVSRRTVERLPIPWVKIGRLRRYRRDDVQAYLDARGKAA